MSEMPLEKELETYNNHLAEWTADNGKFVLIRGDEVKGVYGTYEDALKEGFETYGLNEFLVKQIQTVQQVQFISRLLDSACLI